MFSESVGCQPGGEQPAGGMAGDDDWLADHVFHEPGQVFAPMASTLYFSGFLAGLAVAVNVNGEDMVMLGESGQDVGIILPRRPSDRG